MLQESASSLLAFLDTVITTDSGYFELGLRNGSWLQEWYEWPGQREQIADRVLSAEDSDAYFTAHLFKSKDSHKDNVLPSRTIQADLDHADIASLALTATVLNRTSPGRHQGFWIASQDFDSLQSQEQLSRKLTYSIPLCDRSGWSLGHKVRLPYTKNYKYKDGPYQVDVVAQSGRLYSIDELEILPELGETNPHKLPNGEWIESPPLVNNKGAYELLDQVKDHLSAKVYAEYTSDVPSKDRSLSLYNLELQLFRAGLQREDVYWVAYHSPNNKFRSDLRFNHERELAKHVLVAEGVVKTGRVDIRQVVNDIRKKTKLLLAERKKLIYDLVYQTMAKEGDFIHCVDGRRYYIPHLIGRPIDIEQGHEAIHSLLDIKYSLNATEIEHTYTVQGLIAMTGNLPETAQVSCLAHYDMTAKRVLVHGGRKDVYEITPKTLSPKRVDNGSYGVVFPWDRVIEPFTPVYDSGIDWAATLFDLPNVVNMSPAEARCVLKVYLLFSLLKDAATSRPILAFLGQPGSGKTSTARKLYAFYYGRHMDVSGATSPISYDVATSSLPFFVLDNLDTWEKWIPDRLAQSAGKSDVIVRKLYTNNQAIRIKRQAMVAVTAHDPKFGRADVTDRMLIISLQRFSNMGIAFQDEGHTLNQILANRNKLWGAVLADLQKVLTTEMPASTDLQLRIQDFARIGEWISIALGEQDTFREAITSLQAAQRSFNLDEDHILVTSIQRWVSKRTQDHPRTQDELYSEIISLVPAEDIKTFQLLYKNSSTFTKRISNLQDTLSNTMFKIDITTDKLGQRVWDIHQLDSEEDN